MFGTKNLFVNSRGGQHDDRNAAERFVVLDFVQQFASALLGQFQIQQDQIGAGSSGKTPFPSQEFAGLFAVADQCQTVFDLSIAQRLDGQFRASERLSSTKRISIGRPIVSCIIMALPSAIRSNVSGAQVQIPLKRAWATS